MYKLWFELAAFSVIAKMSSETEAIRKINFIENELPKLIVSRGEFKEFEVIRCTAELSSHLDGFMSAIYMVNNSRKIIEKSLKLFKNNITLGATYDESTRRNSVSRLQ